MLKRLFLLIFILYFAAACIPLPTPTALPFNPTSTASVVLTSTVSIVPTTTASVVSISTASVVSVDPTHLAHLPNPSLTPGDVFEVTSADVCVSGYATKVRDVPDAVKNQVYQEYGILSHQPGAYEVDHLISLELGGSNSIKNLWPEPYYGDWNAHVKDKLEDKLHVLVCNGGLDLQTAQQAISTDWVAAYLKYIGQP